MLRAFFKRVMGSIRWRWNRLRGKQAQPVHCADFPYKPEYAGKPLYDLLAAGKSVCYVGDSVTEGNENGGHGWYEPLATVLPGHVRQWVFAQGGATSAFFLKNVRRFAKLRCDAYVIAFGTNDVRYRKPEVCAMDAPAFVERVDAITKAIRAKHKGACIIFIAPWTTRQVDHPISAQLTREERFLMLAEYSEALRQYALAHGCRFVEPTPLIRQELQKGEDRLLVDHIHPNATTGILAYTQAVLDSGLQGGM